MRLKVREFVFPQPRPVALLAWAIKKIRHPIVQPLRKSYTIESARACLGAQGSALLRIVTSRADPSAPLAGSHVVAMS